MRAQVPRLREELGLDFVVANGENAASGSGITTVIAKELLALNQAALSPARKAA